jgi:uncharacterized protein YecE (DUF72 family)
LKQYGIAGVVADSGERFAGAEMLTNAIVYLRLHGPDGHHPAPYATDALETYARKIIGWLSEGYQVWAFFNNGFDAHAVRNAHELKALVASGLARVKHI